MANTLRILLKPTGEYFNVPYEAQTTIHDLIKYVCAHTIVIPDTHPDIYYLTINNSDTLDGNRTVREEGLDQPNDRDSLAMCVKTAVLCQRISQSRAEFWQTSDETSFSASQQQMLSTTTATVPKNDPINDEVHILVCGGPKVGKSTLINALCGCPVVKTTTIGLDRCTQKTTYYQLDNIYFWDTPGIQRWSDLDINSYLNSFARHQTPLCMFYCASPGSFTKLAQLDRLLDECIRQRHIFCVLVVTNMFASVTRHAVLNDFKTLLSKYIDGNQQIKEEDGVWYYGQVGLCTMVNSQEHTIEDTGRQLPQQGINELVLALTKSFNKKHQLDGWLRTIEKNQQFWLNAQEKLYKLIDKPHEICLTEIIKNI